MPLTVPAIDPARIIQYSYKTFVGPVAQLGARLTGSQEVRGSIPLRSIQPI